MEPKALQQLRDLQSQWTSLLPSPSWYLTVIPQLQQWMRTLTTEEPSIQRIAKVRLYDYFETKLRECNIGLGSGGGMDDERRPIDTIVIHHTSNPPGMSEERLSAIELIRLYAPYFLDPKSEKDRDLKGRPIRSGHVRNGQQVFWPYHWIIRTGGRVERLLNDSEIGWHAGDWDINCRSVGIVFDNDYEWGSPGLLELEAAMRTIVECYGFVSPNRILGHQEVTSKTTCPSRFFLRRHGMRGWKDDLQRYLGRQAAA